VADRLVAQQRAHVGGQRLGLLGQRRGHVDLHQEMHAAAQVQTQVHRLRAQPGQPLRRARHQVQRDDVGRIGRIGIERAHDRVARLELGVGVAEAGAHRVALELDEVGLQAGGLQGLLDPGHQTGIDLQRGLAAGDLDGRRLAEEVGQRVEQAHHHRDGQDQVLPPGVAVHRSA